MNHTTQNNPIKIILSLFITIMLFSCDSQKKSLPEVEAVKSIMIKVCDYELANTHLAGNWQRFILNSWVPSSFYPGLMAMHRVSKEEKYIKYAKLWAEANKWQLAPRFRHADDHLCGQTFIEIYELEKENYMIENVVARFDSILNADTIPGREDWDWSDALYMAPPAWARLGKVTGDSKYYEFLNKQYFNTVDYLFDESEALFYRDKRFFDKRSKNGKKIFWSRGNAWVVAGIPRILDYLNAEDVNRIKYEELLQKMSERLITLQGDDGLWRASLLDYDELPAKESSGTAMFCFGMAWGINNGVLDKETYLPIVLKAWDGLCKVVNENGRVCYVQPGADSPQEFPENNTHAYAVGAFLLAGEQMIELVKNETDK